MPLNQISWVRAEDAPLLPPPTRSTGGIGWLRANLLSTPLNAVLTVISLLILAVAIPGLIQWALIDAVWTGTSREDCIVPGAGACWAYIKAKLPQFIFGRYPIDERWRVILTFALLAAGLIAIAVPGIPGKRWSAIYLLVVFPVVAFILLTGGNLDISATTIAAVLVVGCAAAAGVAMLSAGPSSPLLGGILAPAAVVAIVAFTAALFVFRDPRIEVGGFGIGAFELGVLVSAAVALVASLAAVILAPGMPGLRSLFGIAAVVLGALILFGIVSIDFGLRFVETPLWGGLLVTLVVAIVGIVASLPLGVLLALGRRSRLPVIRLFSVIFIEFWRGVPLITVLFMASVMLPIFLPPGVNFDKLLRALIGVALFSAAYMAEVVRGGLQAIPKGQYEGAMALGLGYWPRMRLIILPQALTLVIPGIVNSFIALFKDTSLVLIIGIMDLLGIIQSNNADANWASPATPATGYAFAAVIYWVFCFSMSRYSIYTERRLSTAYRRG